MERNKNDYINCDCANWAFTAMEHYVRKLNARKFGSLIHVKLLLLPIIIWIQNFKQIDLLKLWMIKGKETKKEGFLATI